MDGIERALARLAPAAPHQRTTSQHDWSAPRWLPLVREALPRPITARLECTALETLPAVDADLHARNTLERPRPTPDIDGFAERDGRIRRGRDDDRFRRD